MWLRATPCPSLNFVIYLIAQHSRKLCFEPRKRRFLLKGLYSPEGWSKPMGDLPESFLTSDWLRGICRFLQSSSEFVLQGAEPRLNSFITRLQPKPSWGSFQVPFPSLILNPGKDSLSLCSPPIMIARSILYCCLKEGLSQAPREASHPADRGLQLYPPLTYCSSLGRTPRSRK